MSKKDMVEIVPSWDVAVTIARGVFENPKATDKGYQSAIYISVSYTHLTLPTIYSV